MAVNRAGDAISEYLGFGAATTGGGSSPTVETVDLVDDELTGSLRYALETSSGSRLVKFSSAGYLDLATLGDIYINNGNVTIDGRTASGKGAAIKSAGMRINADNVIIQHMRFLRGAQAQVSGNTGDCLRVEQGRSNIILDHCLFAWSVDELVNILGTNVTLQWCILAHPLANAGHAEGEHSKAIFTTTGGGNLTLRNCLIIHSNDRNPVWGLGDAEMYNCVVANCLIGPMVGASEGAVQVDYRGNVIIAGNDTISSSAYFRVNAGAAAADKGYYVDSNNIGPNFTENSTVTAGTGIFKSSEGSENRSTPYNHNSTPLVSASKVLGAIKHFCGPTPFDRDTYSAALIANLPSTASGSATGDVVDTVAEAGGEPTLT